MPGEPTKSAVTSAEPPAAEDGCRSRRPGELRLGLAGAGSLRWVAVDLGEPLEEVRASLDLSPVAAVALGRTVVAAALLLRFSFKVPGRLLLEIQGDGPLGKVFAEVDDRGYVRGLVGEPRLATPPDGRMSIGWAVGRGVFKVTRQTERGLYESQVELVSGEIGKDLVHFLEQSQQIRSAALLGVHPRPTGIAEAGGAVIEALPGTPEATLKRLEANIARLGGVSVYLEDGGLEGLLDALLCDLDRHELERHELRYGCGRGRENLLQKLCHLTSEEVDSIVDPMGCFSADCAFCGRRYTISRRELIPVDDATVH